MKKFVFTLQTVYDLALSTQKQQKIQLKRIEDRLARLMADMGRMKASYLDAKDNVTQEMAHGLSGERLMQYNAYFEGLINTMVIQKENILQAEAEHDRWMAERIKTRREIKTLEKVRDAQYEAYRQQERLEDEKQIDDLVSYRAGVK